MRQRGKWLVLSLLAALLLAGCAGEGGYTVDAPKALVEAGVFSGDMEAVDGEIIIRLYGMDESTVTGCAGYLAINTSVSADEAAVFILSDEKAAQAAEEMCHIRLESQIDSYTSYGPDQVPRLERAVVSRKGNTVLLAVGDPDKLPAAVEDLTS